MYRLNSQSPQSPLQTADERTGAIEHHARCIMHVAEQERTDDKQRRENNSTAATHLGCEPLKSTARYTTRVPTQSAPPLLRHGLARFRKSPPRMALHLFVSPLHQGRCVLSCAELLTIVCVTIAVSSGLSEEFDCQIESVGRAVPTRSLAPRLARVGRSVGPFRLTSSLRCAQQWVGRSGRSDSKFSPRCARQRVGRSDPPVPKRKILRIRGRSVRYA